MSPRGGGGSSSSSSGGGRGGGSTSSSSGSKGSAFSGSSSTKGSSSTSSKGSKGFSSGSGKPKGIKPPKHKGGSHHGATGGQYYTSATIPASNNNPLSFLHLGLNERAAPIIYEGPSPYILDPLTQQQAIDRYCQSTSYKPFAKINELCDRDILDVILFMAIIIVGPVLLLALVSWGISCCSGGEGAKKRKEREKLQEEAAAAAAAAEEVEMVDRPS
ncbi:MAG: hypothetical protein Q9222_000729 [Ikaeria aurantiellina]